MSSSLTNTSLNISDGSDYSTNLTATGIEIIDNDDEKGFTVEGDIVEAYYHGGTDYIKLNPHNGEIVIKDDASPSITLINRDLEYKWIINAGTDLTFIHGSF